MLSDLRIVRIVRSLLSLLSPLPLIARLFAGLRAALSLPASVSRHYLSLLLSAVLYVFVNVLRIQPAGYIRLGRVQELQKVIDHLNAQVELYRGVVRELKDDLSQTNSDRKMALKRLKTTKEEIKELNERLYAGNAVLGDGEGREGRDGREGREGREGGDSTTAHGESYARHLVSASFLAVVTAVVLFHGWGRGSVFEWKVVMSVGFPLAFHWVYVGGDGMGVVRRGVMLMGMWWLLGFLGGIYTARVVAA